MDLTTLAWLSMLAYSVHILEEYELDWRNWAREVIKLPVEWRDFYVTNGVVVAVGIGQAMVAERLPLIPLVYASLMAINAIFFHVLPMLFTRGRFSPGAITAVVLFLPCSMAVWRQAVADGSVDAPTALLAILGGAVLMAFPVVLLRVRTLPYFQQERA
ncbi:HXXEE domain-containing protein [Ancylobacter sonchi]|uniref:HXXEE domain-containing protein n=1 Tax=Ancylobacter sonchi TaxID=1937790 RepID=UPI001BD384AA|nr:HXXEE domain-containing protein [Ancylobacter sonchi]MBS7532583.1 HXXEE domain-containing protein [Ancylobacter sonchi]